MGVLDMFNRKVLYGLLISAFIGLPLSYGTAQVVNPGVQQSGAVSAGNCAKWGPGIGQISDAGSACGGSSLTPANPTATAGPSAVNGAASTYMRSDAAPAVQMGSAAQPGILQVDGVSITETGGVISAAGSTPGNPTATAGPSAINGVATTFMRSDAAPAVQQGSAAQKGIVQVDGTTITAASGVISGAAPANPSATAGPAAINGVASTFMRSDAAPAIQKGTNSQFGIVEGDGTTIDCATTPGLCVAKANGILPTPTRAGDVIYWNGSAWVTLAGNNATNSGVLSENSAGTPIWSKSAYIFSADYGTVCDGSTNDATAMSNFTSALASKQNVIGIINSATAGNTNCIMGNNPLQLPAGSIVKCAANMSLTFTRDNALVIPAGATSGRTFNGTFSDCRIDGTSKATYTSSYCLSTLNGTDWKFERLTLNNCSTGIFVTTTDPVNYGSNYNRFEDIKISGVNFGINMDGGTNSNDFRGVRVNDITSYGVYCRSNQNTFSGMQIESWNAGTAFEFDAGCIGATVSGIRFEGGNQAMKLESGADSNSIIGAYCDGVTGTTYNNLGTGNSKTGGNC